MGLALLAGMLVGPFLAKGLADQVMEALGRDPATMQMKMQLEAMQASSKAKREASQQILAYLEEQSTETAKMMKEIRAENYQQQRELHLDNLITKPIIAKYLSKPSAEDYTNYALEISSGGVPFDPAMPVTALMQG